MDKDIVDGMLFYAQGKEVDYVEVRAHNAKNEQLVIKNGTLDSFSSTENSGFCVRILTDGGLGFASSNRWTKEEARKVVDLAYRLAKNSQREDAISFTEEKSVEAEWIIEEKKKIGDIHPEDKIEELMDVDESLASSKIKIPGRIIGCTIGITNKYFVNSEGSVISSLVPKIFAYTFMTVVENGKPEQAYKQFGRSGGWEAFDEWKMVDTLLHEATMLQTLIKDGKGVKPGKMDLVCGTEVTGIAAHESCGHPMEADRILGREMSQAGRSFIFPGGLFWLGSKIGSDIVTIVDDPTIENSYGYYEYDDEGIRARRRHLYKDGVINEFLHNRETAAKLGTRSNGSSRANRYDREAIVRMANTFVEPGDFTEEEILEDIKHGIYMKSFTEWNIDDRRFNQRYVGREAFLVEDGELKHPIARPVIETTTETWWGSVDAISKNLEYDAATCGKGDPMQGIPVYTGGPVIRLRGVYVR